MRIPYDKKKHIAAGFVIGIALPLFFHFIFQFSEGYNLLLSGILLAMISYGFELFSLVTGMGHYDIMDAVATFAGGVPGLGIAAFFVG